MRGPLWAGVLALLGILLSLVLPLGGAKWSTASTAGGLLALFLTARAQLEQQVTVLAESLEVPSLFPRRS